MFLGKIYTKFPHLIDRRKGYSDQEIAEIELAYNLKITGELRVFLSEMGRSDGGLIGSEHIRIYGSDKSIRNHVLNISRLCTDLREIEAWSYIDNQPFIVLELIEEGEVFFIQTLGDNRNVHQLIYADDPHPDAPFVLDKGKGLEEFYSTFPFYHLGKYTWDTGDLLALYPSKKSLDDQIGKVE